MVVSICSSKSLQEHSQFAEMSNSFFFFLRIFGPVCIVFLIGDIVHFWDNNVQKLISLAGEELLGKDGRRYSTSCGTNRMFCVVKKRWLMWMQQLCERRRLSALLLEWHAQLWWENNTSMDHLHLKGNIYHGKGRRWNKAPLCVLVLFLSLVYVSVCAAHQQCLLNIHRGIWWGTIHAPWCFL